MRAATNSQQMTRMRRAWAFVVAASALLGASAHAWASSSADARLARECRWLAMEIADEPSRDDAFGIVMKQLMARCEASLAPGGATHDAATERLSGEVETLRIALSPSQEAAEATAAGPGERSPPAPTGAETQPGTFTGTWHQKAVERLGKKTKRTLKLRVSADGKTVTGTLYGEVWYEAPKDWVAKSCGGKKTFRMVTKADISGEVEKGGKAVDLRRAPEEVLTCTCPSRCRPDKRKRGYTFRMDETGVRLEGGFGRLRKEGAAIVRLDGASSGAGEARKATEIWGVWEAQPDGAFGIERTRRIEIRPGAPGRAKVLWTVKESQDLPLTSWKEKFCDGADRFAWVDVHEAVGEVTLDGGRAVAAEVAFPPAKRLACSCPVKCKKPKKRRSLDLELGVDGVRLEVDGAPYRFVEP